MSSSSATQARNSSVDTPKASFESGRSSNPQESAFKRAAKKVAKAAKEHHKSVNSAFDAYYGPRIIGAPQEKLQWGF